MDDEIAKKIKEIISKNNMIEKDNEYENTQESNTDRSYNKNKKKLEYTNTQDSLFKLSLNNLNKELYDSDIGNQLSNDNIINNSDNSNNISDNCDRNQKIQDINCNIEDDVKNINYSERLDNNSKICTFGPDDDSNKLFNINKDDNEYKEENNTKNYNFTMKLPKVESVFHNTTNSGRGMYNNNLNSKNRKIEDINSKVIDLSRKYDINNINNDKVIKNANKEKDYSIINSNSLYITSNNTNTNNNTSNQNIPNNKVNSGKLNNRNKIKHTNQIDKELKLSDLIYENVLKISNVNSSSYSHTNISTKNEISNSQAYFNNYLIILQHFSSVITDFKNSITNIIFSLNNFTDNFNKEILDFSMNKNTSEVECFNHLKMTIERIEVTRTHLNELIKEPFDYLEKNMRIFKANKILGNNELIKSIKEIDKFEIRSKLRSQKLNLCSECSVMYSKDKNVDKNNEKYNNASDVNTCTLTPTKFVDDVYNKMKENELIITITKLKMDSEEKERVSVIQEKLINELYQKNKLLESKLIKYKTLSNKNNECVNNNEYIYSNKDYKNSYEGYND